MVRLFFQRLDMWLVAPWKACLSPKAQLVGKFWRHGICAGYVRFFHILAALRKKKKKHKERAKFWRSFLDTARLFHNVISDVEKPFWGVGRDFIQNHYCRFCFPSGPSLACSVQQVSASLPWSSQATWPWSVCWGSAVPLHLEPVSSLWFPMGYFKGETFSRVWYQFLPLLSSQVFHSKVRLYLF